MSSAKSTVGELAGYHIYWSFEVTATPAGKPGMVGPMREADGSPVVWPPGVDLRELPGPLPPARFLQVPVDARGRELPHLPTVETTLADPATAAAFRLVMAEATRRLAERISTDAQLAARFVEIAHDDERKSVVLMAMQLACVDLFAAVSPVLDEAAREQLVERMVQPALAALRKMGPVADEQARLDRVSFNEVIANVARCDLDRIRAALDRADHDDAAVRALARVKLGLDLPAVLVAEILVGLEQMEVFFALARTLTGEVQPLLANLRGGRLAADGNGLEQIAFTAFALWQLGPPEVVRPDLLRHLRRLARRPWLSLRAQGLVAWLANQLRDPHLTEVFEAQHGSAAGNLSLGMGQLALDLWGATVDEILMLFPERASENILPGRPTRAAPKVGRNEPCPCGSGTKFKKCCADKPGSLVARTGPSRTEQLRELEPRLQADHLRDLSRADLARLDLSRLRDLAVVELMRRYRALHDWSGARRAATELARRRGKEFADGHLEEVVMEAVSLKQFKVAAELLACIDDPDVVGEASLTLALARRAPDGLEQLEVTARSVLDDPHGTRAFDLAHAVLDVMPALGILLARGTLGADHLLDGDVLLEKVEEARDDLLLPPGDPAQEVFTALGGVREKKVAVAEAEAARADLTRAAAQLRSNLEDATTRLGQLQRQVADHERQLKEADRAGEEARRQLTATAAEERDHQALRTKVEELKGLIRQGNEERSELRRHLTRNPEDAQPRDAPAPAARHVADVPDDGLDDLVPGASTRAVVIPRFDAHVRSALEAVPRHVAAETIRTVGGLAAGDAAAWRNVKQAKDMSRQVLMARIGIHHRLLFRIGDGELPVIDLVTRENLMITLKRLRDR